MNTKIKDEENFLHAQVEKEIDFYIPFGPQHPASGHYHASLGVIGETVVKVVPSPGYLHRGFEKLMEYRTHPQNAVLVDRLCILEPFTYEMGYSNVAEIIANIEAPIRAKYIRTIMAELGRFLSHLTWIGVLCMVIGLHSGTRMAWGDRERILRIIEIVCGGRMYPCYFTPGGVRRDITDEGLAQLKKELDYFIPRVKFYDNLVFQNWSFIARMKGNGKIDAEKAIELGTTGPNLRACGITTDLRVDIPYEAYSEAEFKVITREEGDGYARCLCRRDEMRESLSIIRQLVDKLPSGDFRTEMPKKFEKKEARFCLESARGEACYYMVSDGNKIPYRVKVRGPSFSHALVLFPYLAQGQRIADIPALYWSIDSCPADMDR